MTHQTTVLEAISLIFGYIYMGCWSASFYPQPLLNWKRKSTSGVNIDFFVINVLGFVAYFIYCYAARYSDTFRREYALRHHGLTPLVPFNDLLFAAHAVVLTTIALTQFLFPKIWGFEIRRKGALGVRASKAIQGFMAGCVLSVAIISVLVVARNDPDPTIGWAFIDVIYTISYVKLLITIVKYMPQVLTNYRNSSTNGWSIFQILLDFTGGVLSNAQLGLDSYNQGDWSGITGNIVKLGLGNVSIFFDVIFIVQHYLLYAHSRDKDVEGETDPLLEGDDIAREERVE